MLLQTHFWYKAIIKKQDVKKIKLEPRFSHLLLSYFFFFLYKPSKLFNLQYSFQSIENPIGK